MIAGFGDDCATVGMTNQQHRTVLRVDDPIGGRYVFCNRGERVLDSRGVQSCSLQEWNYLGPAGSIGPRAVNKNNILY
jgi:hypothetical protein